LNPDLPFWNTSLPFYDNESSGGACSAVASLHWSCSENEACTLMLTEWRTIKKGTISTMLGQIDKIASIAKKASKLLK
jgi:hypothetical protein